MIANMTHGGGLALLGLPSGRGLRRLGPRRHSMLTLKGVFGREMFETWYAMSVLLKAGLDISPVITHRMRYTDFEAAFDAAAGAAAAKSFSTGRELMCRPYGDYARRPGRPARRDAQTAGLYKPERVIGSPQGHDVTDGGRRPCSTSAPTTTSAWPTTPTSSRRPAALGRLGLRHGLGAVHLRHPGAAQSPRGTALRASSVRRTRSSTAPASTPTAASSRRCWTRTTR